MKLESRRRTHRGRARCLRTGTFALGLAVLPVSARAQSNGDSPSLTNFAMLRATADDAVREMLPERPPITSQRVVVVPGAAHAHNWIFGELIGARLNELGYRVWIEDAPLSAGAPSQAAAPADSAASTEAAADTTAGPQTGSGADMLEHLQGLAGAVTAQGTPPAATAGPQAARMDALPEGDIFEFHLGLSEVKYIDESRAFFLGPGRVQRGAVVQLSCRVTDGESGHLEWVGSGAATHVDRVPKGKLAAFESTGFTPARVKGAGLMRVVEPVIVSGIVAGLVVLFYTNQN